MPGKIFLNYRREDDAGFALALYGRLEQSFSPERLFMDVEGGIPAGDDFVQVLEEQVNACDVLLVLIGQGWLNATDETGRRRLDNPEDFVRIEIESALRLGKRVIPVLIKRAEMPRSDELPETVKPLARRNAVRLTQERFRADVQGLVKDIEGALRGVEAARQRSASDAKAAEEQRRAAEEAGRKEEAARAEQERRRLQATAEPLPQPLAKAVEPKESSTRSRMMLGFGAAGAVAALGVGIAFFSFSPEPAPPPTPPAPQSPPSASPTAPPPPASTPAGSTPAASPSAAQPAASAPAASPPAAPPAAPRVPAVERKFRLTSSFPKSTPELFESSEQFVQELSANTSAKLRAELFAAGEIIPGLQVLDAVAKGTVEMGWTYAGYYWSKDAAFGFIGGGSMLGIDAAALTGWAGGSGKSPRGKLFAEQGVVALPCSTLGPRGLWARKRIETANDFKGLKLRLGGAEGAVFAAAVAAVPFVLPAGDIYPALEKGVIDGAGWGTPSMDERLGFPQVARYYYYPVFDPSVIDLIVTKSVWESLAPSQQEAIAGICQRQMQKDASTAIAGVTEAVQRLKAQGATVTQLPRAIAAKLSGAANELFDQRVTSAAGLEAWRSFKAAR